LSADIMFDFRNEMMLREVAVAEAAANAPIAIPDPDASDLDIEKIINDRLVAKMRVHDLKVTHGLLFGTSSPYYGAHW